MTKILKHAGVEYEVDKLIAIKGQGINIKTNSSDCVADSGTIISADIKKPLVIKQNKQLLILIDSSHPREEKNFEVVLISRHILKKAKVEIKAVSQISSIPQGSFRRSSPWILSSESARSDLCQ